MNWEAGIPPITSVAELYAIAYQIETDAVERYTVLAEQMQTHNNSELARIFSDLARAEGLHAAEIRRLAGDYGVETRNGPIGPWKTDSPEAADLSAAHYLMTPRDALQMALVGEERALGFFTDLAKAATEPVLRKLAAEFAVEEQEHVELCHRLLRRYPPPGADPYHDPDPPRGSD
jgi:rubrerythrin